MKEIKHRGGKRKNAGRKPTGIKTTVVSISLSEENREYLGQGKLTAKVNLCLDTLRSMGIKIKG